ncbi:MAG: hypothetical protein WBX09_17710 [Terracidiphilus sp.]
MSDETQLSLLLDIRNWIRAAAYQNIKLLLQSALPDAQSRKAYQMLDGKVNVEQVRIACKMSPNKVIAFAQKWTSMGLMEATSDKKRRRLFDLCDFDLCDPERDAE